MLAGIVTAVAVLCSVIGNRLWNAASRALPLTMSGQLIVFETVFVVLYGWMWEQRRPTAAEGTALLLLLGGVALCAQAHRPQHAAPPDRAGGPLRQPA